MQVLIPLCYLCKYYIILDYVKVSLLYNLMVLCEILVENAFNFITFYCAMWNIRLKTNTRFCLLDVYCVLDCYCIFVENTFIFFNTENHKYGHVTRKLLLVTGTTFCLSLVCSY